MKTHACWISGLVLGALAGAAGVAAEADTKAGKELYEAKCTGCHGTDVYKRPDRKVTSLAALKAQVKVCASAVKTGWTDEESAAVADYLSAEFYRFP